MTPEGTVKARLKRKLAPLKPYLWSFWPVQTGMGGPCLDCILCVAGRFVTIETKRPGGKPTPRQLTTIAETIAAGGVAYVIDNNDDMDKVVADIAELIRLWRINL